MFLTRITKGAPRCMPRRTRTEQRRRLEAYFQIEREREARRLEVQLHAMWQRHLANAQSTSFRGRYTDPHLPLVRPTGWFAGSGDAA